MEILKVNGVAAEMMDCTRPCGRLVERVGRVGRRIYHLVNVYPRVRNEERPTLIRMDNAGGKNWR